MSIEGRSRLYHTWKWKWTVDSGSGQWRVEGGGWKVEVEDRMLFHQLFVIFYHVFVYKSFNLSIKVVIKYNKLVIIFSGT